MSECFVEGPALWQLEKRMERVTKTGRKTGEAKAEADLEKAVSEP